MSWNKVLKGGKTGQNTKNSVKPLETAVHGIAKIFREYIEDANGLTSEYSYRSAASRLQAFNFTLKDVADFAGLVSGEKFSSKANYWTAGLFISAAINKVIKKDESVTLAMPALESLPDCVGYKLERGRIIFQGDAGDYLGENMSGGSIIASGDVGNYVGYKMSGGMIEVDGNAGRHVGTYMSGGTISVGGKIRSIPESCKGRIYQGGKQVR